MGTQLIEITVTDVTTHLINIVTLYLEKHTHVGFFQMTPLAPDFYIHEMMLSSVIEQLEKISTPMAYLVCGLLLDGHIENMIAADRYPDGETCPAYLAYMEKRLHDAITFYTKAAQNKALKKVTDTLLWQHKTLHNDVSSIAKRLKCYDVALSEDIAPSYACFKREPVCF